MFTLSKAPVNCSFNEWEDWSDCTVTCGVGERTRVRTRNVAENGGLDCPNESDEETEYCNTDACPSTLTVGSFKNIQKYFQQ